MLLQMAKFHSFLWLSSIPLSIIITTSEDQTSIPCREAVSLWTMPTQTTWVLDLGPQPWESGQHRGQGGPTGAGHWALSCVSSGQVIYMNNQRYMAAIILSEKQCQEHLKETNKSCDGEWVRVRVTVMDSGEKGSWLPTQSLGNPQPSLTLMVLYP